MDKKGIVEGWNLLINRYTAIKSNITQRLIPLMKPIADKVGPFWQPVREKYAQWTEPIRVWHRNLKARSPMLANGIQW